jgi:hypothetical protein
MRKTYTRNKNKENPKLIQHFEIVNAISGPQENKQRKYQPSTYLKRQRMQPNASVALIQRNGNMLPTCNAMLANKIQAERQQQRQLCC